MSKEYIISVPDDAGFIEYSYVRGGRKYNTHYAYRSMERLVCCGECIYYDPPHVDDHGKRIEYKDLPQEAFDTLGTGLVNISYGVNIGGRCCVDYNCGYAEDKRVYRAEDDFCSKGRRPLSSSEKPNNSTISIMEQVGTTEDCSMFGKE